jgi:EAL and modified HD-GYP domain-containing signal transduction protein
MEGLMPTQAKAANVAKSVPRQAGEPRPAARQPILDQHGKTHGYHVLFWNGTGRLADRDSGVVVAGIPVDGSPNAVHDAALDAAIDDMTSLDLERLSCGLPAFVTCAADSLGGEWVRALPPRITVLELPPDTEATPALLAACERLKASGFRLALAGFTGSPESWSLAELADYVKVDIAQADAAARRSLFRRLDAYSARAVATHVETQEQYRDACREGFDLFQGYYFCHPEPLKSHRIPGNRLVHLEILEDLQNEPADMNRLSQLVKCDAGLTYRLLRLVNSPVCAMRQEVTSIQSALMLVGEATFRRIAMVAIANDFNAGQPAEILRMAFERGRFCELAASLCGLSPSEQYLIGMVSLFPAMLRILMDDLVRLLPLRTEARETLTGKANPESLLLRWREAEEAGDWAACDALVRANGVDHGQVMRCHREAIAWADAALK